MNIIHTTSALSPEFGGPVRTVPWLCYELAKHGNKVSVVYLDFGKAYSTIDLPQHENLQYLAIPVKFNKGLRPILVPGYRASLYEIVKGKNDIIFHDNGIWLPYSGDVLEVARRSQGKVITTIHGMLEPWAMNFRRSKKIAGWYIYQKNRLMKNTLLHATSVDEARNLRELGLMLPITVIPNGTQIPDMDIDQVSPNPETKTILFLSRIHPKKGLLNLIKAIDEIKPQGWKIIIAGYDEGNHQEVIQRAVNQAGLEDYFSFPGPIDDQEKWELYRSVDLFILPSYSENFGMVVAEALASGLPVITTQGTPWNELVDYNCGWWIEPTVPALIESLREAFALENSELRQMGRNGRQLVEKNYSWSSIADKMIDIYSWMLNDQGKQPDSII